MYNTQNRDNEFYMYDYSTDRTYFIGNESDLIKEIAKNFNKHWNSNNPAAWSNKYYDNLNVTGNDLRLNCDYISEYGLSYEYCLRNYRFYDGYGRTVDIKKYYEEAIKMCKDEEYHSKFIWTRSIIEREKWERKRRKKRQDRKHHTQYGYYHDGLRTKRTKTLNSIPEHKDFVRYKDEESPMWRYDKIRKISCCWKDQNKDRKQWEHRVKLKNKKTYVEKIPLMRSLFLCAFYKMMEIYIILKTNSK